jgi:predicted ester cyclase
VQPESHLVHEAATCEVVRQDVVYNGEPVRFAGYRDMLRENFSAMPDLRFDVRLLVCEAPYVAGRLVFECAPATTFSWACEWMAGP